jgi:hypothetical protein
MPKATLTEQACRRDHETNPNSDCARYCISPRPLQSQPPDKILSAGALSPCVR